MHALFAVHGYKPAYRVGGPILSVAAIAERMVTRGHRVTVFTTNANLDEELDVPVNQPINVDGVEVWYFARKNFLQGYARAFPYLFRSSGFLYAPAIRGALDRVVPDVDLVHTHLPFIYPSYAAAKAALRFGKPIFYHQRGVFDPGRLAFRSFKKRLYIQLIEMPIMRRATELIALTTAERDVYRSMGLEGHCSIVPNGIDCRLYRLRPRNLPKKWGIPADATVVLFLGRLHPTKGAHRLLEAFRIIHEKFPSAMLVMAGPDEFQLEKQFRSALDQSPLRERVVFTGMVSGEAKLDLLARADLFCLPSDGEGFSMAILEALASGTPVLISPGCHFDEVESAGAGIVSAVDPQAWAAALSTLLSDSTKLKAMGENGRVLVSKSYDWDNITDQLVAVYENGIRRSQHYA